MDQLGAFFLKISFPMGEPPHYFSAGPGGTMCTPDFTVQARKAEQSHSFSMGDMKILSGGGGRSFVFTGYLLA
jgi:hypothetical protein